MLVALAPGIMACAPTGTWQARVFGEAFVEEGIPADEVDDGWDITFSTFTVSMGEVRASRGEELVASFDDLADWELTTPSDGLGQLVGEVAMEVGEAPSVSFRVWPGASGCSVHAVGEGRKTENGQERVLSFDWCFDTDTDYVNCETDDEVTADQATTTELTIHADHLFYDDLVSSEPNVSFGIFARADADGDGVLARDELEAHSLATEERYQVGNADVDDLWGFVEAQTRTVGHINGEGHCDNR